MSKFLFNNSALYRGIRHTAFFALALLLFSAIVFLRSDDNHFGKVFIVTFTNAFFFFAYGYITVFLLVPKLLFKRWFLWFILSFVATGFFLSFLKLFFSDFVYATTISSVNIDNLRMKGWRFLVVNTKDMSFIVALFAVAKYTKDWLYAERQRKIIEAKNAEAKLKLLQSQFDPHFLFNTLNNLYSLSVQKSDQTLEVIKRLKMILRYLLVDVQGNEVLLENEIMLIKNYLFIEKIRYGERLKTKIEIETDDYSRYISPMLFFPIIENCFKHGSSIDAGQPWINLKFECGPGYLSFLACNSKPSNPSTSIAVNGDGLKILKRRLDLLYSNVYKLEIQELKKEYRVKLEIDLR